MSNFVRQVSTCEVPRQLYRNNTTSISEWERFVAWSINSRIPHPPPLEDIPREQKEDVQPVVIHGIFVCEIVGLTIPSKGTKRNSQLAGFSFGNEVTLNTPDPDLSCRIDIAHRLTALSISPLVLAGKVLYSNANQVEMDMLTPKTAHLREEREFFWSLSVSEEVANDRDPPGHLEPWSTGRLKEIHAVNSLIDVISLLL